MKSYEPKNLLQMDQEVLHCKTYSAKIAGDYFQIPFLVPKWLQLVSSLRLGLFLLFWVSCGLGYPVVLVQVDM